MNFKEGSQKAALMGRGRNRELRFGLIIKNCPALGAAPGQAKSRLKISALMGVL
jgi:hypothetical protein